MNTYELSRSVDSMATESQIGDLSSSYSRDSPNTSNSSPDSSPQESSKASTDASLGDEKTENVKVHSKEIEKRGFVAFVSRNRWTLFKLSLMLFLIVGLIVAFFILAKVGLIEKFLNHVKKIGKLVLLIVGVGEIIAGFPIPNLYSLLAIFGGFCYGDRQRDFWQVWLVAWVSAVLGYTISFLSTRSFFREKVKRMMQTEFPFFSDVEDLIELQAWKFVFLLRFTPIPFGILNVILATTKIPTHVFILAGILPVAIQTALFSYLGTTLKDISQAISSKQHNTVQIVVIVVEVVATVLVLVIVGLIGRKAWHNLQVKRETLQKEREGKMMRGEILDEEGFVTVEISTPTEE